MQELIFRYFGAGASPNFSKTFPLVERDPYRRVREELARTFGDVSDTTDFQYDLSCVFAMRYPPEYLNVRLSLVGPYAVLIGPDFGLIDAPDVQAVVEAAGFQLVDPELLESPVTIWSPEYEGSVYEFLFETDNGTPANRDSGLS